MNSLLVIALLGFMCSSAYSLTCETCKHMVIDTKPEDEAQGRAEALEMWQEGCLAASGGGAAAECVDPDETDTNDPFCYTLAASAKLTYMSNYTGEGYEEKEFDVDLYKRGCALLVNTTASGTYEEDAEIKDYMDIIMPAVNDADDPNNDIAFDKYKGELVICDEDDCNKAELDEVSGSTAIGASACLLGTMLTLLVVGRQA